MAGSNQTFKKRERERARQDKRREKERRREERKHDRATRPTPMGGEDPDIAGIVPGPQPIPDEFL